MDPLSSVELPDRREREREGGRRREAFINNNRAAWTLKSMRREIRFSRRAVPDVADEFRVKDT